MPALRVSQRPSNHVHRTEIPIFPLSTVLVPGGHLPLQIFEPRYLELISDCARNGTGFGVCLILEGSEAGTRPQHASLGTLAHIRDFNTLPNGLLGITAEGSDRFRIESTREQHNGLLIAQVSWLEAPPQRSVPEPYLILSQLVERLMEQVGDHYPGWSRQSLDDADWISFRLVELLPIGLLEKQSLLAVEDVETRLQRLLERLPDFQRSA